MDVAREQHHHRQLTGGGGGAYLTDFEQLWAAGSIKATGVNDIGTATVRRASVGWTDRIVTEAGRQLYGKNRHHLD
jgi:hypothetical protein